MATQASNQAAGEPSPSTPGTSTIDLPPGGAKAPDPDSDTDSLLAKLESELDLSSTEDNEEEQSSQPPSPTTASLLHARRAELQSQSQTTLSGRTTLPTQYTGLQTPTNEAALIKATADAPAAVVVFYSRAFASSVRMRDLVSSLAQQYAMQNSTQSRDRKDDDSETVFFVAEAEKCEWLCRRLKVKVLPVVMGYVDGREVGRVVGFEGLKGGEDAGWQALGWLVGSWNGSWNGTMGKGGSGGSVLGKRWMEWIKVEGMRGSARDADSDDESDEERKEERRRLGFIGGAGTSRGKKISGRRRGVGDSNEEDDDDWD